MYIEVRRIDSHQMVEKYGRGLDSYLYKMVIVSINHKDDANLLQSVSNFCFRRQLTVRILYNYHHDTFMLVNVIPSLPFVMPDPRFNFYKRPKFTLKSPLRTI